MIQSLPPEEIKQLAIAIRGGEVFTDRHARQPEDLPIIFMALAFAGEELHAQLLADPPGLIYEYMHKAGPQAVNGYPMFFSARMLNCEDAKTLFALLKRLHEAEEAVLTGAPTAVTVPDEE